MQLVEWSALDVFTEFLVQSLYKNQGFKSKAINPNHQRLPLQHWLLSFDPRVEKLVKSPSSALRARTLKNRSRETVSARLFWKPRDPGVQLPRVKPWNVQIATVIYLRIVIQIGSLPFFLSGGKEPGGDVSDKSRFKPLRPTRIPGQHRKHRFLS